MYDELGKLSNAWEGLEKQIKKKVYDLASVEDRISKANTDVSADVSSRTTEADHIERHVESESGQQILPMYARQRLPRRRTQEAFAESREGSQGDREAHRHREEPYESNSKLHRQTRVAVSAYR